MKHPACLNDEVVETDLGIVCDSKFSLAIHVHDHIVTILNPSRC